MPSREVWEWAERIVAEAPPLTDEQIEACVRIFSSHLPEADGTAVSEVADVEGEAA